ncbi:MAG: DUF2141 domain-containing protein [Candidatus Margulisiibacteriota bacterium]|jgi:uncharacterized protein (DUF2141 family)
MRKLTFLLILGFLICCFSVPFMADQIKNQAKEQPKTQVNDPPKTGNINIVITGLRNNNGKVLVGLYNSADTFLNRDAYFKGLSLAINNRSASGAFTDIPYGTYAIAFFQDENNSGKLDYSFIGMPLEGIGFSTNFKSGLLKRPTFNDVKFDLVTSNITIDMDTDYL